MAENGRTMSYVVQVYDADDQTWADLPTVTVPARTKHRTVLRRALAHAGVTPPEEGLLVRLLDADTAEATTVLPKPLEPGPRELWF